MRCAHVRRRLPLGGPARDIPTTKTARRKRETRTVCDERPVVIIVVTDVWLRLTGSQVPHDPVRCTRLPGLDPWS
ncbi:hypothetical protein NHX12_006941 [Muraenolepis orangiensis]|uniref:Uncharacterized protein n=1 Tax=Muraenolepis orangiensis TaxID=630683 RepID=A0A9Q0DNW7_9TELE|nr:hypothetical protein NHX12_006941 [Muraenolepis orangiensis]